MTAGDEGHISYDLLKTEVDVLDIRFCNGTFSYYEFMKPGMICAQRITVHGKRIFIE